MGSDAKKIQFLNITDILDKWYVRHGIVNDHRCGA